MHYTKTLLFIALSFISGQLHSESFVVKKKKSLSTSALKTNCCDMCGDLLDVCSELIENISALQLSLTEKKPELIKTVQDLSKLQRLLLTKSREILEATGDSFFAKAKKNELQECFDKSKACHKRMTAFNNKIEQERMKEVSSFHEHVKEFTEYIKSL